VSLDFNIDAIFWGNSSSVNAQQIHNRFDPLFDALINLRYLL
jgi:hypothetical protein